MITDTINQKIADAMKAGDEIRLSTLRLLSSSLHNARIEKRDVLNEDEEIVVVRKEAKKRKDAIEAYTKVGAKDRAEKERKELEILKEFLPKELSEEEVEKVVDLAIKETGAESMADFGKVMSKAMAEKKGLDGKQVSEIVKKKLS